MQHEPGEPGESEFQVNHTTGLSLNWSSSGIWLNFALCVFALIILLWFLTISVSYDLCILLFPMALWQRDICESQNIPRSGCYMSAVSSTIIEFTTAFCTSTDQMKYLPDPSNCCTIVDWKTIKTPFHLKCVATIWLLLNFCKPSNFTKTHIYEILSE